MKNYNLSPLPPMVEATLKSNINMFIKSSRLVKSSLLALFILASGIFFSHSVYAGTSISISNSSNNISFTSVKPSASGSVTTATDTIDITTDCSAGSNVYISAVDGSSYGTNLVNNAAASNNTISTLSGTTIGTTALSLENNTWGFNTDSTAASNGNYYGLPAYTNATDHAIYSGTNTTVPIYYGAKVTNALVPGKYIGQVLYTATVNSSCLNYTVIFNKNANDATGTMNNQTMTPAASTALTSNGFTRPGYIFLGWSTDQNATTPTYTDGQAVIDITTPGGTITLHAIWKNIYFQEDNACSTIPAGNNNGGILKDSRDNQEYRVYRWPSTGTAGTDYPTNMAGFCIMTQDLSLGYTTGGSVTRGGNLTLTTDDSAGAGTINGSWADDSNVAYYNNGPLSGSEAYTNHSYYNATASLIVCPKGWRLPTTTEYNNFRNFLGGSNANSVSKAKSSPYNFVLGGDYLAAGYSFVNSFGSYYTASKGSYFHIEAEAMNVGSYTNSYGRSVRCISDPADGYMQDYDTSTITTNQTVILRDARDGNSYTIKRLEDGKVWMVQNLRLTKVKLTPDDSNVSSTFDLTSLNQSGQNWCSDNNTDCYNKKSIYYNESSRYSYGAIYNYYTATAGTGSSITTGNAPSDICPKGWRLPTVEDFINLDKAWGGNGENRNDANTYNIFAGPYTNGNNGGFDLTGFIYIQLYEVGTKGRFLSSTAVNSSSRYQLDIIPATNTVNPVAGDRRDVGGAIRCVSKITNAKGFMQDFDVSNAIPNVGNTIVLADKRDFKEYTVKRLPDGKVWMSQNLTIGSDGARTLTAKDTNIDNNTTYYLPPAGKRGSDGIDNSTTLTATNTADFNWATDNHAETLFRSAGSSTNDSDTGYYNFYTATLGFSYIYDGVISGSSTRDICPKGWRLPKVTDSGKTVTTVGPENDFAYLALQYGTENWNGSPTAGSNEYYTDDSNVKTGIYSGLSTSENNYAGFSLSGIQSGTTLSGVGSQGYFWSSSVHSSDYSYRMQLSQNKVYPHSNHMKNIGYAVRCIAK